MPIPGAYTGDSWQAIKVDLVYAADKQNGRSDVNGVIYPRVTNATALSIAQAWRKLLRAYKIAPGPFWPELWYAALGYHKTGDRFQMTHAHAGAEAPAEVQAAVWEFAEWAADRLDDVGATPRLLALDQTFRGYEAAAQEAYAQLKADRARRKIPAPPTPPGVPNPPDIDPPPVKPGPPLTGPPLPDLRGAGILLALLVIAIALSGSKRR